MLVLALFCTGSTLYADDSDPVPEAGVSLMNTFCEGLNPMDEKYWEQSTVDIMKLYKGRWSKELDKDGKLVFRVYGFSQDLKFFGEKIVSLLLTFQDNKLVEIKFDLWNKGDASPAMEKIAELKMEELIEKFKEAGVEIEKTRTSMNSFTRTMETHYTIEAGATRVTFIPQSDEYYSICANSVSYLKGLEENKKAVSGKLRDSVKDAIIFFEKDEDIASYSKKLKKDFVQKNIHMIGGHQVSDKALDRWADENLKNILSNCKKGDKFIEVPMVDQGPKGYCAPATLTRIILYYDREADLNQVAQLMGTNAGGGTYLPDIEKAVRSVTRKLRLSYRKLSKFRDRDVKKYIDRGAPLFWTIPGHIRLIVGYNEETNEILYSDSWGFSGYGRMPIPQAEECTYGLCVIK